MYLLALTIGYGLAYVGLCALFPHFFENAFLKPGAISKKSLAYIVAFACVVFVVSAGISDMELSNRVLHVFGGGFLAFFICFLAARDSRVRIRRFQFFLFSFLIVIALGVANEILEFFLQNYFHFGFTRNVNDTWLDLISNVAGALIASLCLLLFVPKSKTK